MKITYTNTTDDYAAFMLYHFRSSPSVQKKIFWSRIVWPIAVFLLFACLINRDYEIGLIAIGAVAAVFVFLYIPYATNRSVKKEARKTFEEGEDKSFRCEHELEISESELIERTHVGTSSNRLD